MNEFANQFGAGIIVAYFLEALKKSNKFKFLNMEDTVFYKSVIGFIAALITTIGIQYSFDYSPELGGKLIVQIPMLTAIIHGILDFAKQWAFQQAAYDGFVRKHQ